MISWSKRVEKWEKSLITVLVEFYEVNAFVFANLLICLLFIIAL